MRCPHCDHENLSGDDVCAFCGQDLTQMDRPAPTTPVERSVMEDPLESIPLDPPPLVEPNTPLSEVVALLVARNVGAVLVASECGLAGIFSERDLLTKVGDRYAEWRQEPVGRFMTPRPEVLSPDDPIAFALNRMDVGHFRHIPLVDGGVPIGLVSIRRILRYLTAQER